MADSRPQKVSVVKAVYQNEGALAQDVGNPPPSRNWRLSIHQRLL